MSANKLFNGDYSITSITNGNVNVTGKTLNVYANLNVFGVTQQTTLSSSSINNNYLILNDGYAGGPLLDAGIKVNRGGDSVNVAIKYTESVSRWQISNDGTVYGNILIDVGGATGTVLTSANVHALYQSPRSAISGAVLFYGNTPGPGASGAYISNSPFLDQELIIKTKALIYTTLL